MSLLVVLYKKGIYICMESMQKLLFFCKTYNTVHGVHGGSEMWKNSGTYEEKTQAYIISINVTTPHALIQNTASIRSLRVNAKKNFQQM